MLKNIFVIMVMFFIVSPTIYAETRIPVIGSTFDDCIFGGGEQRESENYYACCPSEKECIVCRKGTADRAGGDCKKVSARSSISQYLKGGMIAPNSLGKFNTPVQRTSSLGDRLIRKTTTLFPTKALSNKSGRSGVKPIQKNRFQVRKQVLKTMSR